MSTEIFHQDAMGQAALVAAGELSATDLVEAAIARIEAVEPDINALISEDFDRARERAKHTSEGAFGGVPFLLKDLFCYPGLRCTFGSRLFSAQVAEQPSPYSERLDAAGLIPLGKTATSEFGLLGSTETRLNGITRNPWGSSLSAAGSSGGAAAAVASGMVPFAHASDGGGSIRIPASLCGLFGFKPGRGRIAPTGVQMPVDLLVEHAVTRSVRDSAMLLSLTEQASAALPVVGYVERAIDRPLRIGYYSETLMGEAPDEAAASVLARTVSLCRELGHEVMDVPPPPVDGQQLSDAFFTVAGAGMHGMAQGMEGALGRALGEEDLEPFTLSLIEWFRGLPGDAFAKAQAACEQTGEEMERYLQQYDVVLCPTVPETPWPIGELSPELERETLIRRTERIAGYTPVHNIAGVPAMSVPLFTTAEGWPLGSHFAARRGGEAMLLGLAYQLEQAAPWMDRLLAGPMQV